MFRAGVVAGDQSTVAEHVHDRSCVLSQSIIEF